MKIVHRVAFTASLAQRRELLSCGIEFEDVGDDFMCLVIDEGNAAWPMAASLISKWEMSDLALTEFSRRELAEAKCLVLHPSWHHGYPQPEEDFRYLRTTYDATNYCDECGTGAVQNAPFRMLREPKWGTKQILQLNWVMGEYFVTPDAWQEVFKPLGIEALPVLKHKTEEALKTVVQLHVTACTAAKVDPNGYRTECCQVCKRVKLAGNRTGKFPHVELSKGSHIAKTLEYFGSDRVAWHTVVGSATLYQSIIRQKLKGLKFSVIA